MATSVASFDTGHQDTVHDSQFDYYGQRLATCSSDGLVRVFAVNQDPAEWVADLVGHSGPVWQVQWGHPKFGSIIASASFDHTVIVWKENTDGSWYILHRTDVNLHTGAHCLQRAQQVHASLMSSIRRCLVHGCAQSVTVSWALLGARDAVSCRHYTCNARCTFARTTLERLQGSMPAGSINSVAFAPADLGLVFAAASSDGNLSVHTCNVQTGEWAVALVQNERNLPAHPLGATSVSFAPAIEAGALTSNRARQVGTSPLLVNPRVFRLKRCGLQ